MANPTKKKEINPELQNEFENIMADADALFVAKKYSEASDKYQEAAILIPSESLPKQKMKEIDDILNDVALSAKEEKEDEEQTTIVIGRKDGDTESLVEVRSLEDHDCNIGGTHYKLRANRTHKVPASVANILAGSKIVIKR